MADLSLKMNDFLNNESFLFDNAPCGQLSYYPDGTIFRINQTLLNWIGLSSDQLIGKKKFNDILSFGGKMYYQMVVHPLLTRQGFVSEINFEIDLKNGTAFPSLVNATNIKDEEGKIVAVQVIIVKITDRKKYEAELLISKQFAEEERKRFESLSNIIPEIIWTALSNGNVNFTNQRFFEYFKMEEEAPRKASLLNLFLPAERKKLLKLWIETVKKGEKFEAEVLLRNQADHYEWFLIRAVPYKGNNERIDMWFGSCTNINEHKKKQLKDVENLNYSLSEKEKTLEEIAYSQSHLVRRPLANIIGLVEMLDITDKTSPNNTIVEMLKKSAEDLDNMVKDIVLKV